MQWRAALKLPLLKVTISEYVAYCCFPWQQYLNNNWTYKWRKYIAQRAGKFWKEFENLKKKTPFTKILLIFCNIFRKYKGTCVRIKKWNIRKGSGTTRKIWTKTQENISSKKNIKAPSCRKSFKNSSGRSPRNSYKNAPRNLKRNSS